mmetsp:Transcript_16255/g.29230  ORF Transcript_16255/g.29230 Transcript_16255/m.29230 type:complete len:88 (+) Transcript_16255:230-493(+)
MDRGNSWENEARNEADRSAGGGEWEISEGGETKCALISSRVDAIEVKNVNSLTPMEELKGLRRKHVWITAAGDASVEMHAGLFILRH